MKLSLPEFSLVLLIGASGSGKSTFARTHFLPTEVVSSDTCRGLVADDENDQSATQDAFEVLHVVVAKRLARRRLTVVDATNVQRGARASLVALARTHHALPAAVVLDVPEAVCLERNRLRSDRTFGPQVVARQQRDLKRSLKGLKREGFRSVTVLSGPEIGEVQLERRPLWNDRRGEHGPFDIIGDVHGCAGELEALLERLGYTWRDVDDRATSYPRLYTHPQGRKAIFVGDLVDRGPRVLETVGLVRNMVEAGAALCVPGNHDVKLVRKLRGKNVAVRHGLGVTLAEFDALPADVREGRKRSVADFLDALVSHYVLDDGKLVVAHAGLREDLQGRASGKVREFALYGDTTGETDPFGLPVRNDWAADYRGAALVAYGHTPVPEPRWLNGTVNLDTGCVFGGALTALRYPELETLSVAAAQTYAEPVRPFVPGPDLTPQQHDDLLGIEDVTGRRLLTTRLRSVVIREEQSAAALASLSSTVDPKWLVYLPPTMAAPITSSRAGTLEHPDEAFAYYRKQGVTALICEEKHMGSRAICVVCRDEVAAQRRFGVVDGGVGVVYTRTGKPFFTDSAGAALQTELLQRLRDALSATSFWQDFATDWVVLDAELTPWSYKAGSLLRRQYAPTAATAERALGLSLAALGAAQGRGIDVGDLPERFGARLGETRRYAVVYRRYCWPVGNADDLKLAPFALLATEGVVHDEPHVRQLETLRRYLETAPNVIPTAYREVDLDDLASVAAATAWWEELTAAGGEGVVVKPASPVTTGKRGAAQLVQPGIKVRGRDYLRLVYGPEYLLPENLERLRPRNVAAKRSLALQEFALGLEALERFVRGAPLREVHECVAGVLALESEPLDPRL